MATYLDIQERIVNELQRTDLSGTVCQNAIQDAIKHYMDECFRSAQTTTTSVTVAATQAYALPTDFSNMIAIHVTDVAGNHIPLVGWPIQELDAATTGPNANFQDLPVRYALFGDDIYLWPIPDQAYTLTWFYNSNLTPPSIDTGEGFWVNEAERMIRCWAKGVLWSDVIQKDDKAQAEFAKADLEFKQLMQASEARAYDAGRRAWDYNTRPYW